MKYGIYYAYWAREWGGDFLPFISKVKRLGFDVLEVNCGSFPERDDSYFRELRRVSEGEGVLLSGGYGPRPEHNLSSADPALIEGAFRFWADVFHKMELSGIDRVGGALYSYWPVDFRNGFNKAEDTQRSIENIRKLAGLAAVHGITLNMEVLNRFEGYMLNECEEAVCYVKAVGKSNVKVMLDTFHMNIEEESIGAAIRTAGSLLGHFHTGECNRMVPGKGRTPWREIGEALRDIQYDKTVVMEPFVMPGGTVGQNIKIWRDIVPDTSEEALDRDAKAALEFERYMLG